MRTAVLVASLVLPAATASAHITMTSPAPRTVAQKSGPCGAAGSTRGATVTKFAPGATIMVEWDETVEHPGHYRIAFDDDGNDFKNPNNPGDAFEQTLVEPIEDKDGGHYVQAITLPTTPCSNCTIQLVQVMTVSVPFNSFYFQCADIQIGEGGDPGVDPGEDPDAASGGCSTGNGGPGGLALALALVVLRRRKQST
jgi:MYXO-CTERM domain-containing protein